MATTYGDAIELNELHKQLDSAEWLAVAYATPSRIGPFVFGSPEHRRLRRMLSGIKVYTRERIAALNSRSA